MLSAVSNTFVGLSQTICIGIREAFPGGGKVPVGEWFGFLKEDLGLTMSDITEAFQHSIMGALLVRVEEEEKFREYLGRMERGVLWKKHGSTVYGWSAGEEVVQVALHNIFSESDLDGALRFMSSFGTIVSKQVMTYKEAPTVKNGIVNLRMRLKPEAQLPTYIYEEKTANTIQVFSDKQQRICYRCLGKGHIAAFCRKPRKTQVTAEAAGVKTWAKIAAATIAPEVEVPVIKHVPATDQQLVDEPEPVPERAHQPEAAPVPEPAHVPDPALVLKPTLEPEAEPESWNSLMEVMPLGQDHHPNGSDSDQEFTLVDNKRKKVQLQRTAQEDLQKALTEKKLRIVSKL